MAYHQKRSDKDPVPGWYKGMYKGAEKDYVSTQNQHPLN